MITVSLLAIYNAQVAADDGPSFLHEDVFKLPSSFDEGSGNARPRYSLANLILSEGAELEARYPDAATMNTVVKAWSTARLPSWNRIETALNASYNPIHNYDRTEEWTEETEGENSKAGTMDRTSGSMYSNQNSASLTQNVAGYNSATATVPKSSDSSSGSGSGRTDGGQNDDWSEDGSHSQTVTKNGSVSGNIGVTTNQQMIEAELELRKLDLMNIIKKEFLDYFCLGVY